jgi:hypothetical protein
MAWMAPHGTGTASGSRSGDARGRWRRKDWHGEGWDRVVQGGEAATGCCGTAHALGEDVPCAPPRTAHHVGSLFPGIKRWHAGGMQGGCMQGRPEY